MTEAAARRRVTATDVARSLGISRATVGFVLNNTPGQTISEATRQRVLAEAERLGYRPHAAARALARGSSRLVLLVLPDWPLDFSLRRYVEEASAVLDRAGYSLVTWTQHVDGRARPLWETLDPDVVVPAGQLPVEGLATLRTAGVRLLFEREGAETLDVPDFTRGPALQVDHLAELGHRRLGYAIPDDPRLEGLAGERLEIVAERARELGVEVVPHRLAANGSGADSAVRVWRAARVTAVAGYNDDAAAEVLGAALRSGLRVPDQLAVLGYDDSPLARLLIPAMSSIHVDTAVIGRYVAEAALWTAGATDTPPAPTPPHTAVVRRATT